MTESSALLERRSVRQQPQNRSVMWWSALSADSHYLLYSTNRTIVDNTSPVLLSGDPLTTERASHGYQCYCEFGILTAYNVCSFLPKSFHSKRQNSKRARILKSIAPSNVSFFLLYFFLSFHFVTYFFLSYLVRIMQSHTSSPFSPLSPYSVLLLSPWMFINLDLYWIPRLCITHVLLNVAVSSSECIVFNGRFVDE